MPNADNAKGSDHDCIPQQLPRVRRVQSHCYQPVNVSIRFNSSISLDSVDQRTHEAQALVFLGIIRLWLRCGCYKDPDIGRRLGIRRHNPRFHSRRHGRDRGHIDYTLSCSFAATYLDPMSQD